MAEVVALLPIAVTAFQSVVTLLNTVKSFQSHKRRIRNLLEELDALVKVLNSLIETINATTGIDFSALELPLRRCGNACEDFRTEFSKYTSRSSSKHTSVLDWAKLRYMGEDIDGFRQLVAGYKLTLDVALADANLRNSAVTAKNVESCNVLLNTAMDKFKSHLEKMDEKLDLVVGQSMTGSEADATEVRQIKEERQSTEKCLQICDQLAEHIMQIQLTMKRSAGSSRSVEQISSSKRITDEGLQGMQKELDRMTLRLRADEKQLSNQLLNKLKTSVTSAEDVANLTRLHDEWEVAHQNMAIMSRFRDHLRDSSTIENDGKGNATQYMVSDSGKTIHGVNRGSDNVWQFGGHCSNETIQQSLWARTSTVHSSVGQSDPPLRWGNPDISRDGVPNGSDSKFRGRGFTVEPIYNTATSSTGTARSR